MGREIKFRVWDNVDYMSSPFNLFDVQSGMIEFTSDVVIMQYTGLKDKNGKEIYEDDVVELYWPFVGATYKCKVFWLKERACWAMEEIKEGGGIYHYFGSQDTNLMDVEVIGNIHKNSNI